MGGLRGGPRRPPPPPAATPLAVALILMATAVHPMAAIMCLQDGDVGTTQPKHDIIVVPDTVVNVTCRLNLSHTSNAGYDSDQLYFTRNEFRAGGNRESEVPASHVTVLNSSAIVVSERLHLAVKHMYSCRLRKRDVPTSGVCQTNVMVGHPPLNVTNFRCILHNWNNGLNCTWETPFNAVPTTYQWQYRLLYQHYSRVCTPYGQQRSLDPGPPTRHQCYVRKGDFRDTHERFLMVLSAENALGRRSFPAVELDTYAIVLPAAPHNVSSGAVTARALRLDVTVGYPMFAFPKPILFAVNYTSRWDLEPVPVNASALDGVWTSEGRVRSVHLAGLLPHTDYRLAVCMRSSLAVGDMWSPPAVVTVRTLPTVPAAAPTATAGSFQPVGDAGGDGGDASGGGGSRTVYVYWRQIEPHQQNGANFTYCAAAAAADGSGASLSPEEVTPAYARFSGLPLSAVTVRVTACNAEGESRQAVKVTVPDSAHVLPRPHGVTLTVSQTTSSDSRYRLLWDSRHQPPPHNFTVFWCQHKRDRPFQCQGQLEWRTVSGDTHSYLLHLPGEYQFAVAANRGQASSGMVWSRCTVLANGAGIWLGEVYARERGADYLTVAWNGECTDRQQHHYRVYYCRTDQPQCPGNDKKVHVSGRGVTAVNVTGLRPYSEYRVTVAVLSGGMAGERSAPLVISTRQGRPTPPRVTQVSAASNTTLTVTWSAPEHVRGRLDHYVVRLVPAGGGSGAAPASVPADWRHHTFTGLWPYTRYTATVQACNKGWQNVVLCSLASEPRRNYTLPGVPGVMEPPRSRLLNVSAALVQWSPPSRPGGPRPQYTLRIVSERDGQNQTADVPLPAGRTSADQSLPPCEPGSPSQRHFFLVRASVRRSSVGGGGQWLHGPWSEPAQQECVLASDWPTATIVGVVVGGALLMMLVVFVFFLVCSRTKRKLTEMRNLSVNLPAGLERLDKAPGGAAAALSAAAVAERRPAAAGLGSYGRLVSQNSGSTERTTTASVSGQPLLQDDPCRDECDGDGYGLTAPTTGDSNSCSSGATNFTDSGAECEKGAPSPTNKFQWPAVNAPKMSPYVQVGGPETTAAAGAAPPYSKFSPYVDAKAIRALMARSLDTLPADDSGGEVHRSVPDLAAAAAGDEASPAPPPPPPPLAYSQLGGRSSAGYVSMASDDAMPPASPTKPRPPLPPPPATELAPYVTLGPPPPPPSAAGFPPYVLAGPSVPAGGGDGPPPVAACSPAHDSAAAVVPAAAGPGGSPAVPTTAVLAARWAGPRPQEPLSLPPAATTEPPPLPAVGRPAPAGGYVLHDKVAPVAGMELRSLPSTPSSSTAGGYISQEALASVAAGGEPLLSPKKLPTVASSRDPYCRVVTTHQRPPDLGPNVSMV